MIVYFSGTGNSKYVARLLALHLADPRIVEINADAIARNRLEGLARAERIVWVCPIYSWGLPPVVSRFMSNVELDPALPHFLVVTCGDDTGNVDSQWRSLMRARQLDARGCWSVTMPNTYVTLPGFDTDKAELATTKLNAAPERVAHISRAIKIGSYEIDIVRGKFAGIKSGLIRAWFNRYAMSPRPFHSTDACVGCGVCAASCPMDNIKIIDRRPRWSDNCAFCLGCYHHCPTHAVAYGNRTAKKGQYVCPEQ